MSVVFSKPDKRTQWEESFNEAKQKLAVSLERHPVPEFMVSVPIRKTRAGLQFTCAAPTLGIQRDVWVCNSDGYVGQVCVLSLQPEPTVTSCNGVCNARILCVSSVPANIEKYITLFIPFLRFFSLTNGLLFTVLQPTTTQTAT
jgi:Rho guanine nucleotide exchange factor 17